MAYSPLPLPLIHMCRILVIGQEAGVFGGAGCKRGDDINNPPCYSYANAHGTIISGTRITRRYTD